LNRDFTNGGSAQSIDNPAGSITSSPKLNLVTAQYLVNYHHSSKVNNIDEPNPTITTKDKYAVACVVSPFIVSTQYNNAPNSLDAPLTTITANRKWHYLINPAWGGNLHEVDAPCPTIVARQDKAPLCLVVSEFGDVAIRIDEYDTEITRKIKEFMVLYRISDIKMRMLKVTELLRIQGFPKETK